MFDISGSSEEDTQVDQFESGLARGVREADPGKGKGKAAKNKKGAKRLRRRRGREITRMQKERRQDPTRGKV